MGDTDDEIFRAMIEGLEEIDAASIDVTVVSSLSNLELSIKFNDTKQELLARGEALYPTTDTGRDLSSIYHACLVEMKKRGMA